MGPLIAAALALFASHAVLSAPGIRPALIARLGRGGFQAAHAAISTLALAAFIWAYAASEANRLVYAPPYRYLVPGDPPRGSAAEQGAYSYRNELSAERLRLERDLSFPEGGAAVRLRRQGELNRELDRVDRLLNR